MISIDNNFNINKFELKMHNDKNRCALISNDNKII